MAQPQQTIFAFLFLPRELRDAIYESILLCQHEPPLSPVYGSCVPINYNGRCPVRGLINPTLPLQLTCHQTRKEVEESILRLVRAGTLPYALDLMMLNEIELFPTWLSFPVMINHIPKLHVDFRFFGQIQGGFSGWTGVGGWPPLTFLHLYHLLKHFFAHGPDLWAEQEIDQFTVGELVINIRTPLSPPPNGWDERCGLMYDYNRKGHLHPHHITKKMIAMMDLLVQRRREGKATYAKLIFERIQQISFKVDGKEAQSWDLTTLRPRYLN
ncbi:MAG: hypothetical protein Q9219_005118 [cf. Caloplaca sp. 3 TL-2023]